MKKVLIINVTANSGSTGRIAENIGRTAIINGYDSYFAYGRIARDSQCKLVRIGSDMDIKLHGLQSRIFDNHGFASTKATQMFVEEIKRIKPDIINIHNIHGYYLNVEVLFEYLARTDIPVVWTLHDCWPFTGHCSYFDRYHCEKWKTGCYHCPNSKGYPKSLFLDRSKSNYARKKELFNKPKNITFVAVCNWMANNVKASFLGGYPVETIYNGVDVETFRPRIEGLEGLRAKLGIKEDAKVVLGVASTWDKRKGLDDFVKLRTKMNDAFTIVLVGLSDKQILSLPQGIIGIKRTESIDQLAELYSLADVFVNPTYVDNFPTTNIEALACGTPVVTYSTGGSPEAIDDKTGMVVKQGELTLLQTAVEYVAHHKPDYTIACRERAVRCFDKRDRFNEYVRLFNKLKK